MYLYLITLFSRRRRRIEYPAAKAQKLVEKSNKKKAAKKVYVTWLTGKKSIPQNLINVDVSHCGL